MSLSRKVILDKTHYGLNIFSYILRQYYPGKTVLSLSGKVCKPTRNPFNHNKNTLIVYLQDKLAIYIDTDNAISNGDVFDFASLHFKKTGKDLYQEINKSLELHIGEESQFYKPTEYLPIKAKEIKEIPEFSFFKPPVSNVFPEKKVNLKFVSNLLKYDHYEKQTKQLRTIKDSKAARKFKANKFHYVTFSGIFSKRKDSNLIKHSGLITIDFDHVQNIKSLKYYLLLDPYFDTELLFISPSGDGLKWIISIDLDQGTHEENFIAIASYIKSSYNVEVDKSGKDISRACFLPYDPEAYVNPKYL